MMGKRVASVSLFIIIIFLLTPVEPARSGPFRSEAVAKLVVEQEEALGRLRVRLEEARSQISKVSRLLRGALDVYRETLVEWEIDLLKSQVVSAAPAEELGPERRRALLLLLSDIELEQRAFCDSLGESLEEQVSSLNKVYRHIIDVTEDLEANLANVKKYGSAPRGRVALESLDLGVVAAVVSEIRELRGVVEAMERSSDSVEEALDALRELGREESFGKVTDFLRTYIETVRSLKEKVEER